MIATVRAMPNNTPPDDRAPQWGSDGFDCPRCTRWAHQEWLPIETHESWKALVGKVQHTRCAWHQSICARCRQPSIWHRDQLVYPPHRLGAPPHVDLPDGVRELYEEAAAVASVSRRAGAALARATVERLIKHLDPGAPRGAKLEQRIERLRPPRVSAPLWQMLTVVRVAGNQAMHVEDAPGELVVLALDDEDGPAMVEWLLETVNNLVDELISRPKIAQELFDKLPDGVQAKYGPAHAAGDEGAHG